MQMFLATFKSLYDCNNHITSFVHYYSLRLHMLTLLDHTIGFYIFANTTCMYCILCAKCFFQKCLIPLKIAQVNLLPRLTFIFIVFRDCAHIRF